MHSRNMCVSSYFELRLQLVMTVPLSKSFVSLVLHVICSLTLVPGLCN